MQGALVATRWDDPWSEEGLAVRRVAGAIACFSELDVLVPGGLDNAEETVGAVRVIRYRSAPNDTDRRDALQGVLFGPQSLTGPGSGGPHRQTIRSWARTLPQPMQWSALELEGGAAPELTRLLHNGDYDFVVFAGCSAGTVSGMRCLAPEVPVAFVPLGTHSPIAWLAMLDEAFVRADVVLVFTEGEEALVRQRLTTSPGKVLNIRFVFRVHELAYGNSPHGYEVADRVVVLADWRTPETFRAIEPWFLLLARRFPDLELRPLGPGADRLPFPHGTPLSEGRLDTWRWIARSLALLDPAPHRLLGRNAIEALQYGVPVLVPDNGAASREHAERGNGGLWYRSYQDLAACIDALRSRSGLRQDLSASGRAYAEETYGDPKRFISAVTDAIAAIID